jgi:hypothetical protein
MPKPDTEWYKKISEGKKDYPLPLYAPWTAVYNGKFSNKDKNIKSS